MYEQVSLRQHISQVYHATYFACQDYPHELAYLCMENIASEVSEILREILSWVWKVASKVTLFAIWALLALIILPCVFVAGHIYPLWQEWGEEF